MIRQILEWRRQNRRLSAAVMGINRRNLELVLPFNSRRNLVNVNEKVLCKQLLEAGGIPVSRTIMVCRTRGELREFERTIVDHSEFAIKPGRGYGGVGILLITGTADGVFLDNDKQPLQLAALSQHVQQILDGVFSLDNYSDSALIEELIKPDESITALCGGGVPDIRIIVFRNRIVSGMLRLPTKMSGGKANLHQGGVGVGIDVVRGVTTRATVKGQAVSEHPDTGATLGGVPVPHWERIVELSPLVAPLVGLGYIGIDYVIDRNRGILVLEVNGRPGLQIQMANMKGLRERFQEILNEE